ncbi:hypothetical protein GBS0709_11040 [Edwardsiella tarda]|nr:hypothetical protein GBS0709_11040 [Edwardsiella tarda]
MLFGGDEVQGTLFDALIVDPDANPVVARHLAALDGEIGEIRLARRLTVSQGKKVWIKA